MSNYKEEINAEVDNYIGTLLDTWQCKNWEVTVREFFDEWAKQFKDLCNELVDSLEREELE